MLVGSGFLGAEDFLESRAALPSWIVME
jgi:hypothetical protein